MWVRMVHNDILFTHIGGAPVSFATKKDMAISSQFLQPAMQLDYWISWKGRLMTKITDSTWPNPISNTRVAVKITSRQVWLQTQFIILTFFETHFPHTFCPSHTSEVMQESHLCKSQDTSYEEKQLLKAPYCRCPSTTLTTILHSCIHNFQEDYSEHPNPTEKWISRRPKANILPIEVSERPTVKMKQKFTSTHMLTVWHPQGPTVIHDVASIRLL